MASLIEQLGSVTTVVFHEEVDKGLFHFGVTLASHCLLIVIFFLLALCFQVISEELNVEKRVKDVCAELKVKVHTCWGSTLYHRDDLPFHHISRLERMSGEKAGSFFLSVVNETLRITCGVVRLPDVYTQFRKPVESQCRVRPVFPSPEHLKPLPQGLEEGAIPTAEDLEQKGK